MDCEKFVKCIRCYSFIDFIIVVIENVNQIEIDYQFVNENVNQVEFGYQIVSESLNQIEFDYQFVSQMQEIYNNEGFGEL